MRGTDKTIVAVIFVIALLVRMASVFDYDLKFDFDVDETGYNNAGLLLLNEHRFYIEDELYSKPPGYPFFISVIYFLFGYNLTAVRICQALLDSILCVLLYLLCLELFGKKTAIVAAVFSTFYLLFIKSVSRLLTESLFTFMLFLAVFYIYKTRERFSFIAAVIIGVLLAALSLIKGSALLFFPFLFACLLILRFYKSPGFNRVIKRILVASIAFIISMAGWTYRNYKVYHAFVPVSTQGGFALYGSFLPRYGKVWGAFDTDENILYAMGLKSQVARSNYLNRKAIEFIKNHPLKILKLSIPKFLFFWCPFDWELMGDTNGVYNFQYLFMLPFALLGMLLLLRNLDEYAPLYIPIAYILLMCLVFQGTPRFRMPIEPYLIVFFSAGICEFYRRVRVKNVAILALIFYGLLHSFLYLNPGLLKLFLKKGVEFIGLW